jgi:nicotinate-nucleotide adenylyltransferase
VRLGVFGGTFDPPHLGHLAVAEEARAVLGLERVLFIPAAVPPHKQAADVSAAAVRLELVRAAVAGNPGFAVSDLELRRGGPSFTADTLERIQREHGGAELFCLVGSDSAVQLDTWHDPPRLYRLATFVAMVRPGWPRERLDEWLDRQPAGLRPRLLALEVPALDIAASDLRRRMREGRPIRYLVPDAVRAVIDARGLYREGGGAVAGDR